MKFVITHIPLTLFIHNKFVIYLFKNKYLFIIINFGFGQNHKYILIAQLLCIYYIYENFNS